jgi:ankyrin repeat protein
MTRSHLIVVAVLIALLVWVGWAFYATARQARLRKELTVAVNDSDLPAVRRLLAEGADPNTWQDGDPPPTWQQRLAALLGEGTLPPRHRADPLLDLPLADYKTGANAEIVRLLLDHGADPNAPVDINGINMLVTPLNIAVEKGSPAMIALLLEHGGSISPQRMGVGTSGK